jgi:hypothetical protein
MLISTALLLDILVISVTMYVLRQNFENVYVSVVILNNKLFSRIFTCFNFPVSDTEIFTSAVCRPYGQV